MIGLHDEDNSGIVLVPEPSIIEDDKDFLIKDETSEYVQQMYCVSIDEENSKPIELIFDENSLNKTINS